MKKTLFFLVLSAFFISGYAQIYAPEGLNMPGVWNNWINPPNNNLALASSTQVTNGRVTKITTGTARYQTIIKVAATGGDLFAGTYVWLFTSGSSSNYSANKWAGVTVSMNSLQNYTHNAGSDNSITISNDKWYTMNWKDNGYANTQAIFMETNGAPVDINSVSQTPLASNVFPGQSVTVNITTSASPSAEEKIYVRYSTNDFSTSSTVLASFTGSSGTATIPALTGTVKYYIFSTTVINPSSDFDMYTIKLNNNATFNYSYTVNSSWNTTSNGNWSSTSTWAGGVIPLSGQPVTIAHNVTLDQDATVSSLTINSGKTFTASDASPRTLTITKSSSGSSTTLANSGAWATGSGTSTVVFTGAPSSGDAVHTISGSIAFQNITVNKTGGSSNVGCSFGANSSVTGTLEIGAGGFISTAPPVSFYGANAYLKFNQGIGATYNVNGGDFSWSTTEIPNYIKISSGTVNLNASRTATGDLLIDGGTLSLAAGLTIQGNWTRTSGTFTPNSQTVTLSGSALNTVISTNTDASLYDLVVSKTGGMSVSLSSNLTVTHNMTVSSGAIFTISPAKALTVSGTLTNSAGVTGLVIKSDVTNGTGSLKNSTVGVNATVERYIAAATWTTANDGWHFLSSPVATQAISTAFTVTPADEYDFYSWYEPTNIWVNFKNTTVAPTWATANNSSNNFLVGKGYMVAYKNASTKYFTGELNVGNTTFSNLSVSGGANNSWHLLGNPFASALTWDADPAWGKTAIGGVANIWDEAGPSYHPVNEGEVIPAGNGFMVYVSNATNAITIPDAKRTHSAQAWYKNTDYPVVTLYAKNLDEPSYQECQVRFNPEATTGFDLEYDGKYLSGYAPQFYSVVGNDDMMVNSLPELTSQTSVPFSFIKNDGTNFAIEVSLTDNFPNYVFLKDQKTGIDHNLSLEPVYNFTSTTGDAPGRFLLHFGGLVGLGEKQGVPTVKIAASGSTITISNPVGVNLTGNVVIYNLLGQALKSQRLDENPVTRITMSGATGYYLVKVITGSQTYTGKVFIN